MTAEIAIMNKSAVALAADSAVTIGSGQKIYNSANKLFALSRYHPVGIMVFSNANFMGIPWETIIKIYRKQLHDKSFDTTNEYAQDFINFIRINYCNESIQNDFLSDYIYLFLDRIFYDIIRPILKENKLQNESTGEINNQFFLKLSELKETLLKEKDFITNQSENTIRIKQYDNLIDNIIKKVFENIPFTEKNNLLLKEITYLLFTKNILLNLLSVVIDGIFC